MWYNMRSSLIFWTREVVFMRRVAVIGADDDVRELVKAIMAIRDAKMEGDARKHEEVCESLCGDCGVRFADADSDRMPSDSGGRKWWRKFAK